MRNQIQNNRLSNQRGDTLVMVLVAAGIGAIVMAAFATHLLGQQRSQKYLAQKYELMDLKQSLLSSLQNPNICRFNLLPVPGTPSDPSNKYFDATNWDNPGTVLDETDGRIELGQLLGGETATSMPLVTAGQALPGTQTGLIVDKIKLKNLRPIDPAAPPNLRLEWQGVWEVSFLESSQTISMRPVQVHQRFTVQDNPSSPENARRINNCLAAAATNQPLANSISSQCHRVVAPNAITGACGLVSKAFCPPGEVVLSGGASGSNVAAQGSSALIVAGNVVGWSATFYNVGLANIQCQINCLPVGTMSGSDGCVTITHAPPVGFSPAPGQCTVDVPDFVLCGLAEVICCTP